MWILYLCTNLNINRAKMARPRKDVVPTQRKKRRKRFTTEICSIPQYISYLFSYTQLTYFIFVKKRVYRLV